MRLGTLKCPACHERRRFKWQVVCLPCFGRLPAPIKDHCRTAFKTRDPLAKRAAARLLLEHLTGQQEMPL